MDSNLKLKVAKIEKFLFYFLCGFSISLPLSKAAANIFLTLILITFFARIFYKRDDISKIFREYKNIFAAIIFLLAAVFISALVSDFPIAGVKRFLERYVLHMAIILPTIFICFERQKIILLTKLLLLGAFLTNLTVIIQAAPKISADEVWRFGGVLSTMTQGSLLSMFLPIYILLALHLQDRKLKIFCLIMSAVGMFSILLTGTRGAWLAVLVLIPILILIYAEKKLKHFGAILISVSIVGGIFLFTPALSSRVATITDLKMQSNSERLLMWHSAFEMFKDNPIFGVGYGSYKVAYQEKYISPLAKERNLEHAHNNFLQMLAECGMVGELAFLAMIICFTYFCLKGWAREKNLAYLMFFSVLWGLVLHGVTEFNFETSMTSKIFWYSLGLCAAFCRKENLRGDFKNR